LWFVSRARLNDQEFFATTLRLSGGVRNFGSDW
jgi:hypothetical protein